GVILRALKGGVFLGRLHFPGACPERLFRDIPDEVSINVVTLKPGKDENISGLYPYITCEHVFIGFQVIPFTTVDNNDFFCVWHDNAESNRFICLKTPFHWVEKNRFTFLKERVGFWEVFLEALGVRVYE
ncbi:MAG TPA: hypothetical protein PK291_02940, partial [Thermotogota bacterium]|nr:hypothetical protein [Thermotogota bacterium]